MGAYVRPMQRRQFIKSVAATAAIPALPAAAMGGASTVSPALYSKAVGLISEGVYFTPKYVTAKLGLSDALGKTLLAQLKSQRLVGEVGKTGMIFSRAYYVKHAAVAAQAINLSQGAKAASKPVDLTQEARKVLADDASEEPEEQVLDELDVVDEAVDDTPSETS